ncbi:IclR family transcriptional regulator [Salinicoccus sp. HZC-1]|uniref:IclR family transcriptional regulator n=1 Tax=Salinicoccus sp. HZC-1 TaxID=3385497 RepID=UPI00398BB042
MSVKSAERVLDVIDYLTLTDEGATLMELSKKLEIPKSSMSQLLGTMLRKDYLIKTNGNIYKLGHKLITAGNKARISNDIFSSSISILKETVSKTGETVFLAIRSSEEIIYLAKIDSEDSARTTAQPGMRKPLHCTGLGKAFLSFEDEDVRAELLASISLDYHTSHTITDRSKLEKVTSAFRAQGFAIDDEENDLGVYCISAPVYGDQGNMIAAISCAGSKARMLKKRQSVIEEITASAKRISATQGYNGGDR